MAVNIVTGMTGIEHITSHDDRARNASQFGRGKYVFDIGRKFSATAVDDNLVRIQDGMCINQGTQMGIEPNDYADVEIDNGLLGTNRHDIIVMRYEKNEETLLEKASLAVVKGVNSSEPVDPDITEGNILDGGDLVDDMPLYRVAIEGVNLVSIEPLFEVLDGDVGSILEELNNKVDKVTGKGLSTNDYTNADKTKLNNIETGAEVNVQSDWSQNDNTADDFIKHKPSIPSKTSDLQNDSDFVSDVNYVHTDNNYTNADKEDVAKIDTIEHSLSTTSNATGNPISISDSAHVNAEELVVTLEPIQSGSGDPSPENIRPISGYDETSVVRSGKNLFDKDTTTAGFLDQNTGNVVSSSAAWSVTDYIKVVPNKTYTYSDNNISEGSAIVFCYYAENKSFISSSVESGSVERVVSIPSNAYYMRAEVKNDSIEYLQLELGSTATTYEPYTADTYTLQFGDTVYGAEVDFVSGVATVTKGYIAEYAGETLPSTWISDRDVYASGTTPTTGAEVVYELATPYTIQLTPQQIKMLKGNNVLVADGEMDLVYQEDSVVGDVKEWAESNFIPYNTYRTPPVYGFHIDGSNSDPSSRVTYIADNANFMPAYMDYTSGKFRYNSWQDSWFIKYCKPCILNQDGTVKAYLNPNDYTKDIDGNTVVIDENLTGANVEIEFPKIWYKVVPDAGDTTSASVYFSPVKVDEDYKDYAYINKDGVHKEHFYMPAYNGSVLDGTTVMRSLSGQAVSKNLDASTEIAYAKANGDGWNTEDAGEIMLINFLLILMGKSTDTQTVFGRGIDSGDETAFNNYVTGAGNLKGLFYGMNTGTDLVKVFGIENWWGLQWRRYAGDVLDNDVRKVKLCYGNEDGSTTFDFNIDGSGYVDVGVTPSGTSGGYIRTMKFTHDGMYSAISDGSSSTYYCDGQWFNNAYHTIYAIRGGYSDDGLRCGAFYVHLNSAPGARVWSIGAAVSYK